ncbi:hypothetical protein [Nocardia niigatensis]
MSDPEHEFTAKPGGPRDPQGEQQVRDRVVDAVLPHLIALAEIGVIHSPPVGEIELRGDHAVLGVLVLTPSRDRNMVKIVPRHGLTPYQHADLEIQAQHAITNGCEPAECWRYHERLACWFTEVIQPL